MKRTANHAPVVILQDNTLGTNDIQTGTITRYAALDATRDPSCDGRYRPRTAISDRQRMKGC